MKKLLFISAMLMAMNTWSANSGYVVCEGRAQKVANCSVPYLDRGYTPLPIVTSQAGIIVQVLYKSIVLEEWDTTRQCIKSEE